MTGVVAWFTGLPASGKTTLARGVHAVVAPHRSCVLLDGDEVRAALDMIHYDASGRDAFYRALAGLAVLLAAQGHAVLVAATAPLRAHRAAAQAAPRFFEIYVGTPQPICEARDVKGLYRRAHAGAIDDLPGAGSRYEPPEHPAITADGGRDAVAIAAIARRIAGYGS